MKTPSIFKQWHNLPRVEIDESQAKKILSFTLFFLIVVIAMISSAMSG